MKTTPCTPLRRDVSIEDLYVKLRPELVRYARRHLGDAAAEAEDVVQEAFLRLHRELDDPAKTIQAEPWLYTTVKCRAIDVHRSRRTKDGAGRLVELDDHRSSIHATEDVALHRAEVRQAIADVAALPERRREILVRIHLRGEDHGDVAASMGTSKGAAAVLLHRACADVRAQRAARERQYRLAA